MVKITRAIMDLVIFLGIELEARHEASYSGAKNSRKRIELWNFARVASLAVKFLYTTAGNFQTLESQQNVTVWVQHYHIPTRRASQRDSVCAVRFNSAAV